MQLLDHFHPPLSTVRHWASFHARWAASIADVLHGDALPAEYFAAVQVRLAAGLKVTWGLLQTNQPVSNRLVEPARQRRYR